MLTVRRRSTRQTLTLRRILGEGTEGRVYGLESDPRLAAKVYRRPDGDRARKLEVMLRNRPGDPTPHGHRSIAWPQDLLERDDGTVVGFLMPRVSEMFGIVHFMNPQRRVRVAPAFHYRYLLMTARNLAAAVHAIHERGYVVGDFNERNVLANSRALVTLIDTDSFQITDPNSGEVHRCTVGTPPYTPREAIGAGFETFDRTPDQDRFGLAVMIFQLLMLGSHPFRSHYLGGGDPPPMTERIARGWFPYARSNRLPAPLAAIVLAPLSPWRYRYGPCAPPRKTLPWRVLPPRVRRLFLACFVRGHRHPAARPSAAEWREALDAAGGALETCGRNRNHRFGRHLARCPWCAFSRGRLDPFPADRNRVPPPTARTKTPLAEPAERREPRLGSLRRRLAAGWQRRKPKVPGMPKVRVPSGVKVLLPKARLPSWPQGRSPGRRAASATPAGGTVALTVALGLGLLLSAGALYIGGHLLHLDGAPFVLVALAWLVAHRYAWRKLSRRPVGRGVAAVLLLVVFLLAELFLSRILVAGLPVLVSVLGPFLAAWATIRFGSPRGWWRGWRGALWLVALLLGYFVAVPACEAAYLGWLWLTG